MSERWFFQTVRDRIVLRARGESDDGTIGDFYSELKRGENLLNLTYKELKRERAGVVEIRQNNATILPRDAE